MKVRSVTKLGFSPTEHRAPRITSIRDFNSSRTSARYCAVRTRQVANPQFRLPTPLLFGAHSLFQATTGGRSLRIIGADTTGQDMVAGWGFFFPGQAVRAGLTY